MKDARERAAATKQQVREGVDPVEARKAKRAALEADKLRSKTFKQVVDEYLNSKMEGERKKTSSQWRSSLENYAMPELGALAVDDVRKEDVLRALEKIWRTKTETARRVRARIESILNFAVAKGYRRSGDNPARWDGNLKEILPAPSKLQRVVHQPAVPLKDIHTWYAALRKHQSISALAVEFTALTACRSGEIRGMQWSEIDFDEAT